MEYRIEYSRTQNWLRHEGQPQKVRPNELGFETIAENVPVTLCQIFTFTMAKFYLVNNDNLSKKERENLPTAKILEHEYLVFLDYLNGLMEYKMMGVTTKNDVSKN